ncbi:MAG: DUF3089 domain-containing protein [Solirubrobacterales bacterium]
MGGVKNFWRLVALAALMTGFGAVVFAGPASAADTTTWICKPGQSDDLCAGSIDGVNLPPPGASGTPLGYTRPTDPAVDCFYLYPTQSEQETPNSNLDKDPAIRRVVVQQARMFSSRCNVYAPMYRQVTYNGQQGSNSPDVEVAYASAKEAFQSFLDNYSKGRPFVILGHSQGSTHAIRLIDEMIDTDTELRKRFIGAITPGGNPWVPIGKNVGGIYANVPACSEVGEYGCITAFSTYNDVPGPTAPYGRFGYFPYKEARPDPARFEVICTNPALLDGGNGNALPLANTDYISSTPPASESAKPWIGEPDYYKLACQRQDGAHWLNLSKLDAPGDSRPDLGALIVGSSSNYHVPEVNLTEGNLLEIVRLQSEHYLADVAEQDRIAGLKAKLVKLRTGLGKAKKRLVKKQKNVKATAKKLRKAKNGTKRKKVLQRKLKSARKGATNERKRINLLKKQIATVKGLLA